MNSDFDSPLPWNCPFQSSDLDSEPEHPLPLYEDEVADIVNTDSLSDSGSISSVESGKDEPNDYLFELKEQFNQLPKTAMVRQERVQIVFDKLVQFSKSLLDGMDKIKSESQNHFREIDEVMLRNDITILAKEQTKIAASKKQLTRTSVVFEKMFSAHMDMVENQTNFVKLEDYHAMAVRLFVKHCALGVKMETVTLNDEVYLDVVGLAGYFQVPTLLSSILPGDELPVEFIIKASNNLNLLQAHQSGVTEWRDAHEKILKLLGMKVHQLVESKCISLLGFDQIQAIFECDKYDAGGETTEDVSGNTRLQESNSPKSWNSTRTLSWKDFPFTLPCPNFPDKAIFELSIIPDCTSSSGDKVFALKRLNQPLLGGIPIQKKSYDIRIQRIVKKNRQETSHYWNFEVGKEKKSLPSSLLDMGNPCKEGKLQNMKFNFTITQHQRLLHLEVLVKWVNEISKENGNEGNMSLPRVFSHMAFYNPKPASIQTFLAYFVDNFKEVFLDGKDSFLLERRYLAFLLRKKRTNVTSEMEILRALLLWANISFENVGLDFLIATRSTEEKLWVCPKDSFGEGVSFQKVDLTNTATALNHSEPTIVYFGKESENKEIPLNKVHLFRDIENLLPLVRFPFITLKELSSLSPLERNYLDIFSVTGQLTNEAIALQLTPQKSQACFQVLNLNHEIPYKCPGSPCEETEFENETDLETLCGETEFESDIGWETSCSESESESETDLETLCDLEKKYAESDLSHFRKRPRISKGFPQELPAISKEAPLFPLSGLSSSF